MAEKPVVPVGRDLGHRARQSRVAAGGRRVLGSARRLEVLDLNKDTVDLQPLSHVELDPLREAARPDATESTMRLVPAA